MRVLVTGAAGFLGRALLRDSCFALAGRRDHGLDVTVPSSEAATSGQISWLYGRR